MSPIRTRRQPVLYPANANVADLAHDQQGIVGYVHPIEAVPDPAKDASLNYELPVDVSLRKADYIEVVGFADHKATAEVWYRLLNCGFRLPTAAGTDAMENYASLRGPLGTNRVYVSVPKGPLTIAPWLEGIKKGRTFATNGPLIGFSLKRKDRGRGSQTGCRNKRGQVLSFSTVHRRTRPPADHLQRPSRERSDSHKQPPNRRHRGHDPRSNRMVRASRM